jgi:hypothetical protein
VNGGNPPWSRRKLFDWDQFSEELLDLYSPGTVGCNVKDVDLFLRNQMSYP